jgi:hypothetical protein
MNHKTLLKPSMALVLNLTVFFLRCPITLEGKTVQVEVEVFDAPLDYNLLLGRSWIDSMRAVVSTLFRVVHFPHQGKVVTVDQLAFFNSDTRTGNVSFISKTPPGYENVGVGLLKDSSLMGTFPIPPPDVPRPVSCFYQHDFHCASRTSCVT